MSLRHREVHGGCGEFEILRAACHAFCRRLASGDRVLREPHSVEGMHFLKLVLAGEIHNHAACLALHGLWSGLLDVNVAGKRGGAKQVFLPVEQELGLVGAAAHFRGAVGSAASAAGMTVPDTREAASRPASASPWLHFPWPATRST